MKVGGSIHQTKFYCVLCDKYKLWKHVHTYWGNGWTGVAGFCIECAVSRGLPRPTKPIFLKPYDSAYVGHA